MKQKYDLFKVYLTTSLVILIITLILTIVNGIFIHSKTISIIETTIEFVLFINYVVLDIFDYKNMKYEIKQIKDDLTKELEEIGVEIEEIEIKPGNED